MDIRTGDVLVLMGSQSDAKHMRHVCNTLDELGVSHNAFIASAHRTTDRVEEAASLAHDRGYKVIIAGAGLAAALPGDLSARCWTLPILGVAMPNASHLAEMAAVLSMTHLPPGTPVSFCGVGEAGAINAALQAAVIVGLIKPDVRERVCAWREAKSASVAEKPDFTK